MPSIIVVDDEIWTLRDLEKLIRRIPDMDILGAYTNPAEARDAIRRAAPDIVITDLRMDVLSGRDLMRGVSEFSPDTRIILCSAYNDFDAAREALSLNVSAYLLKPIGFDALEAALRRASAQLKPRKADADSLCFVLKSDAEWSDKMIAEFKSDVFGRMYIRGGYCFCSANDLGDAVAQFRAHSRRLGVSFPRSDFDEEDAMIREARLSHLGGYSICDNADMLQVQRYVAENYPSSLSLAELGGRFHFAATYLSDRFSKTCGMNLSAMILRVRAAIAMEMLAQTRKTVQEISQTVGFRDVGYFCKVFKSITNDSPSQYRRIHCTAKQS